MKGTKKRRRHNDKYKRNTRVFVTIAVILLLFFGYLGYVFFYRTKTEPAPKSGETNTDAALYSLKKQMAVLQPFEELYALAFDGRAAETDYGTIPIPGLTATKTLRENQSETVSVCTSMTPQGLTVAGDYLLISAYCHTNQHNSVVYVIDKNTHEFVKEIVLKGKIHAGGLAYDTKHHMIWVSSSNHGRASASAFSLKNLKSYNLEKMKKPIAYTHSYDLYSLERDSFMSYEDGYLYIGHFSQEDTSVVQKFRIGNNGGLATRSGSELGVDLEIALPEDIKRIPKLIQGFAIYEDKVILTQSYGILPSKLLVHNYDDVMYRTKKKYTINKITLPQKLEQIYIDGGDLYMLFESAAYAYAAQPLPKVDRVLKLRLSDVIQVDIKDLLNEAEAIPGDGESLWSKETYLNVNIRQMAEQMTGELLLGRPEETYMDTVKKLQAGAVVSEEKLQPEEIRQLFYEEAISDEVFARMNGVSYKENGNITREDLRYVRVLHYGFDGDTHIGELVVNKAIAKETVQIFQELYRVSYPIEKMLLIDGYQGNDGASMADNNSSAFNYRTISYSDTMSNHARGMAIDINPRYNPYVKTVGGELSCEPANGAGYMDRTADFEHKIDENDACYQIFTQHGFSWGGLWEHSKDYQHFEMSEQQ